MADRFNDWIVLFCHMQMSLCSNHASPGTVYAVWAYNRNISRVAEITGQPQRRINAKDFGVGKRKLYLRMLTQRTEDRNIRDFALFCHELDSLL